MKPVGEERLVRTGALPVVTESNEAINTTSVNNASSLPVLLLVFLAGIARGGIGEVVLLIPWG